MKPRVAILVAALVVAGATAALLWSRATRDPYVTLLEERIDALLPAVERELGASVPGRIRVVVSTREELGELLARERRDLLRAIEGEPPGGKADAAADVVWTVHGLVGSVDEDGTIHVCREELEGAPHADLLGAIIDSVRGAREVQGPEVLDAVLVHELVHVVQVRALGFWAYLRGARHRSDLLARCAVVEGHAEVVTARVTGSALTVAAETAEQRAASASLSELYAWFELDTEPQRILFPYLAGRVFVESAIARLGRDDAVRRLFDEPPSLLQVANPESWPGPRAPDAGTDAMLRHMRRWLDTEWKETNCEPLPPALFLRLLGPAGAATQEAAADALLEAQRIEARGAVLWNALRGHLVAARDEAGARRLHDAWVEAARARDALVPKDPKLRGSRVLESTWSEAEIDGRQVALATRRYRATYHLLEHAVAVRRGRYVLELRLVDDPGGAQAVMRLARRLIACVVDAPEESGPDAPGWEARWRFASDPRSAVEPLRRLLTDADPDVRHAAFWILLRRGGLSADERDRGRRDADPLVRLTALTGCASGEEPNADDLLAAIGDEDPWVAAGAWFAAKAHHLGDTVPGEEIAHALRRPEVIVRRAASRFLDYPSRGEDQERLALARTALADDDGGVREHGGQALFSLPAETPALGETFADLLSGADEDLRRGALIHLSIRDGVPGTVAALIPFLEDEKHAEDAIEALGKLRNEALPAVPTLRRIADESERAGDTSRRLDALVALAGITGQRSEVLGVVRDFLATGTDEEAGLAAGVLEDLGTAAAADLVPELAKRLKSDDRLLVLMILGVLEDLGDAAAPALLEIEPLFASADLVVSARARQASDAIRKQTDSASRR